MKSKSNGICKLDASHTWKEGDEIFISKKGDGSWAVCKDKACFEKQGGSIQSGQKGRTIEMSLAFVKAFDDYAWKLAKEHAKELQPETSSFEALKNQIIIVESIYHTLAEVFNGR